MSSVMSPDRRNFLKVSAAAGGGLLVGFAFAGRMAEAQAPATFTPNAFLRIDRQGRVVVVLPKAEMGQGVYTAIPMMVAEELEVDLGKVSIEIPTAQAGRFGKLSEETGGSTSIRQTWTPVRTAGAAARMILIEAAAARWAVPAADCRADAGRVVHTASKRTLGYGDLVEAASALKAPEKVDLKPAGAYRLIGKATPRMDARDKVLGAAVYGIDVRLPGMKVATLAASPVIGGKLKSVDEAAAMKVKGVRQVVRLDDAVAVVGDHMWAAKQGLAALNAQWDDGANAAVNQAGIVADLVAASEKPGAVAGQSGDVAKGFETAARKVEAVYHQPYLAHAPMEPANCTVHVRKDACEVWVGTQVPLDAKKVAADAAGLPIEAVTLHNHLIGGGFGRRLEADMVDRAVRIAKSVEGPVKVVWTREEDFRADRVRPYYVDRISAGLGADGLPVAWSHRITGSSIIARLYARFYKDVDGDAVESAVKTPYTLPSTRVEFVRQESPVTTSWWRGVGPLRSVFVVESFIDELAKAAGEDPVAYRRRLVTEPRARAVLDLAAEKAGWGKPLPAGHGRGISLLNAWGTYMAQVAEVEVKGSEVRVHRVVVAIDCGQVVNPLGVKAQVEGGVIFGVTAALFGEVTIDKGAVQQSNFHDYQVLRMNDAPVVEAHLVLNQEAPGGVGEPPTAGAASAVANAVFAACGKRVRTLPIIKNLSA